MGTSMMTMLCTCAGRPMSEKGLRGPSWVLTHVVVVPALFSSQKILQNFSDSPSHRIFGHMYEALNIDKK
jgi:hypothetical protein